MSRARCTRHFARSARRGEVWRKVRATTYIFFLLEGTPMLARQTRNLFGKHFVYFVILNFESAMDEMLHYEAEA